MRCGECRGPEDPPRPHSVAPSRQPRLHPTGPAPQTSAESELHHISPPLGLRPEKGDRKEVRESRNWVCWVLGYGDTDPLHEG